MKANKSHILFFLGPNFLGFFVFTLGPILASLLLSFFAWDLFSRPSFVGLRNYQELLHISLSNPVLIAFTALLVISGITFHSAFSKKVSTKVPLRRSLKIAAIILALTAGLLVANWGVPDNPKFWQGLWNTCYLLMGLPLGMAGSLFLANLLNDKIFANRFFRLVFFLPSIVSGVGVFLLWKWIFNPDIGPINMVIHSLFGIDGPAWFDSVFWAKPAFIIMNFWAQVGGTNMILYLAALQSVDPGLHDAAQIDGASGWQRFLHITVPMVSSTSFFILVMGIISGFQGGFDGAYVITRGGPAGATTTASYFIFETAFQHFEMGLASSASVLLFAIVLGMSWVNWKFVSGKVHYT